MIHTSTKYLITLFLSCVYSKFLFKEQDMTIEKQIKDSIIENQGISSNIDYYYIVNLSFYGIVNNSTYLLKTQEDINKKIPTLITKELRVNKTTPKLNDGDKGLLYGIEVSDKDKLIVHILLCNNLIYRYYLLYIDYLYDRIKTKTCNIQEGCNEYDKESKLNVNTVFNMVKTLMKVEDVSTLLLLNDKIDNITKEIDIVNLLNLLSRLRDLLELEASKPSIVNENECMSQVKQVYIDEEEMIKISLLKQNIPDIVKNSIEQDPLDSEDVK